MTLLLASKIVFGALIGMIIVSLPPLFMFLHGIRRKEWKEPEAPYTPKTAVILSLRGPDPFVHRCLQGLLTQDYPDYTAYIVVDHPEDPVLAVVEEAVTQFDAGNVEVQFLTERHKTCSLNNSSLVQVLRRLDASYDVVATIDGDALPHKTWLRELVEPLADERFGAATGNRWYMPVEKNMGSLVRYLWNSVAAIQLFLNHFCWGGTMAIRRSIIGQPKHIDRLQNTMVVDALVTRASKESGLRVACVPSLFLTNRETCSLSSLVRWIGRQMLWIKFYYPSLYYSSALLSLVLVLAQLCGLGCMVAGLLWNHYGAIAWSFGGILLFWLGNACMLWPIEATMRVIIGKRGEPVRWMDHATVFRVSLAMPLALVVHLTAMIPVFFMRKVEWRGIVYDFVAPYKVQMREYDPYQVKVDCVSKSESIW